MTTLDIQRRLVALGYDPGPLDGIRGRRTIAAVRAFQAAHGLAVDGIAGAETIGRLAPRSAGAADGDPDQARPWYAEALRLKGTREGAGAADNPLLLGWARALKLAFASDSVPWCGLFAAHCIAVSLPDEPLPDNPLGARNWLRFGRPAEPGLGAALVFWRGAKAGWRGHVGFYAGEDATAFHVLGGNQADRVSIARVAKARLLGTRWPVTAPAQTPHRIVRAADGALSTNEA